MTREEAIGWLKLDIDMMKFDPSTGGEAYLDEYERKIIEAEEIAIEALVSIVQNNIRKEKT